DGSVDQTFVANTGSIAQSGTTVALQPDGKIIVAGYFFSINGVSRRFIARLNDNGTLDTAFNVPLGSLQSLIDEIVTLPDGKIIIGGNIRLANGEVRGVARLNNDGSFDTSFNLVNATPVSSVVSVVRALEIQHDGKIMIGGQFTQINGVTRGRIARLNTDGTLDKTFNPPSGANSDVADLAVQSNGSAVIGGEFTNVNGNTAAKYLARLLPDGNLDPSFVGTAEHPVYAVEKEANGKILYSGIFGINNFVRRFGLARLNPNGSPDNSFTGVVLNDAALSIFIQNDNKITIAGEFSRVNGISTIGVARLNNARARTQFDFDGDGRADVSVFRPSNGFWYRFNSSNNSFFAVQFGQAGDKPAPADYDGDGKTDIAVFREGAFAYFYILNSSDNTFRFAQFGTTGDLPLTGDWDGDGKADLAVYRTASSAGGQSFFYYRPSSQPAVNFNTIPLGTAGDKPLLGDFDGDGRLDPAVFRPSTSAWIILKSSLNQLTQTIFGAGTDIPVPADYDGDGTANIAVFRPSTGTWYTSQNPANNYGAIVFGTNGDVPVPADFDGDGRAEAAVFRPSNGAWYLNRTTSGFMGVSFGANGDQPLPNAFVR
ncbi:MAG TPA: FG-GAP-like repeat-containing protein, partial [Pyrinomonadaceae bacterium]|nr:FG-GAP-like repeat-containing protein [Pyrinomonadaceae bacterium]